MSTGERIRAWRSHAGLTLRQLADGLHFDKGSLSRIENDKTEPKAGLLERIAAHLGLSMVEFYGDVPAPAVVIDTDPSDKIAVNG